MPFRVVSSRPRLASGLVDFFLFPCILLSVSTVVAENPSPPAVEFNRDVRPIFADNCFACHVPDKNQRKAEFRLDKPEVALSDRGGYYAIVSGKPGASVLYQKITAADLDERMPPQSFEKSLSKGQIETLTRWIEQGAEWQQHWSIIPPHRPPIPRPKGQDNTADSTHDSTQNPVDSFVRVRLEREGLQPSPEADRVR